MSNEDQKKSKQKADLHEVWKKELDSCLRYHEKYFAEARKYEDIYKDQHNLGGLDRYNIFFANTETLAPLVYSKLPSPNITRRYKDDDEASKIASEILERTISYFLEITKADTTFSKARKDFLINGRGLVRVYMEDGEIIETEEGEEVLDNTNKKVYPKRIEYRDFLTDHTAKNWDDLKWVAFRCYKTKDELFDLFGNAAKDIEMDSSDELSNNPESLELWEIWDKVNKQVIWFSQEKVIQVDKDPYNLTSFFPIARPTGTDSDPSSLLPIPLYRMYKSQAEELNIIDNRIRSLTEQIKYTGVYNTISEAKDIENLLNGEDGEFAPLSGVSTSNIKDQIFVKDIVPIANTITLLNNQKAQIINNIREITGLSDIVRGVSIASETATAQRLKGDFAISRIQPLQRANEIAIRDTIEIMAELIVENYTIEELVKITNCQIVDLESIAQTAQDNQNMLLQEAINNLPQNITGEQKVQQIEALKQQAEIGFNKTIDIAQNELKGFAMSLDQVKEVDEVLKNDALRSFSIDIETDSTISVDQQQDKNDRIQFIATLTNFAGQFTPLLQAGMIQPEAFNEFLGFIARPFKVGRNLEEFLLAKPNEEEEQQPSQEELLAQAQNERQEREFQFKVESEKAKINLEQQKIDIEKARVLQNQRQFEDKIDFEDANKAADRQAKILEKVAPSPEEIIKSRTQRLNEQIRND
jgi:hypothetical protein